MPGLSLVYSRDWTRTGLLGDILDQMLYFGEYERKFLYGDSNLSVSSTGFRDYPIEIIQNSELLMIVEGYAYNRTPEEFLSFGAKALSSDSLIRLEISDGEFLAICIDKQSKDFVVFNDTLGKLPLYYLVDNDELWMSRELKFFKHIKPSLELDNLSIAHQLLFSHFLGNSTYFTKVKRLMPGSLVSVTKKGISIRLYSQWNFEQDTLEDKLDPLVQSLLGSCETRLARINPSKVVLALSDGFDSRTVLAVLSHFSRDVHTVTYTGWKRKASDNLCTKIASSVASFHSSPWEAVRLSPISLEDLVRQIEIFSATVPGTSPWRSLLPLLKKRFPETLFLDGSGGNLVLEPIPKELLGLRHLEDVVKLVLARSGSTSLTLKDIGYLTGITPKDILDPLRELVSSCPEKTWGGRYIHSEALLRGFNWEDTRTDEYRYFYEYTPLLWSLPFARIALSIRGKCYSYKDLYVKLMEELGACTTVPTDSYIFEKTFLERLRGSLLDTKFGLVATRVSYFIRSQTRSPIPESKALDHLSLRDNQVFKESSVLDREALRIFVKGSASKRQLRLLFTVLKFLEKGR